MKAKYQLIPGDKFLLMFVLLLVVKVPVPAGTRTQGLGSVHAGAGSLPPPPPSGTPYNSHTSTQHTALHTKINKNFKFTKDFKINLPQLLTRLADWLGLLKAAGIGIQFFYTRTC